MPYNLWDRDQLYRRRLLVVVPIAVIVLIILFASSDNVSIEQIEKQVGWKGALEVLPEISIVFDDDELNTLEMQRRLFTMKSVDLDLAETGDIAKSEMQDAERPEEEEEFDWHEWDDFNVRTIHSNRAVPYSEEYVILKMVEPKYPPYEQGAGIEGFVHVELFVNEAGAVESANVLSWLGPKSFRDSTLSAVSRFEFQPPVKDGVSTSMWVKFMVRFRLSG